MTSANEADLAGSIVVADPVKSDDDDGGEEDLTSTSNTGDSGDALLSTRCFERSDDFMSLSSTTKAEGENDALSSSLSQLTMDLVTAVEPPSQKRRRSSASLEGLTINKLRFSSLGFYGRDKEVRLLKDRLERLARQSRKEKKNGNSKERNDVSGKRELVMISGYSGTGKSALASCLQKPANKLNGLYVSGKFDLYMRDEPLTGVASACGRICGEILALQEKDRARFESIRDQIIDELGNELTVITRVIPALEEVVMQGSDYPVGEQNEPESTEEIKQQFNYAFRRFIRVVSHNFAPLIMVLDDLQWADMASLEIIDILTTDRENPNLMVVGLYRSNEVSDTHMAAQMLRDLHKKKEKDNFNITEIELGNLELISIQKLVQDLLSNEDSSTLGLAEVCLKKTSGNVFFLIRYLSMLNERMLLEFNVGLLKWVWDLEEIEKQTKATDNVVDLLKDHMRDLPESVSEILKLCSFLGSTFSMEMLKLVWREHLGSGKLEEQFVDDGALENGLKSTEEEGFLEPLSDSSYRWIHDKIQEAAASLVPEEERAVFSRTIGGILVSHLDDSDLDNTIFTAVNLLNEGEKPSSTSECVKLAELNCRAAQKAALLSSFNSAAKYACDGIEYLPGNSWSSHYKLTLDLYSLAAEAECSLGHADRTEQLCHAVIDQKECPILDKFRAYTALMDSIANRDHMLEGLELGLDLLSKCGCKFPRSKVGITFQTLAGIMKAKAKVKDYCNEETISTLPTMKDPFRIAQLRILNKLMPYAYLSRQEYLPLVILRGLFWTMKYGLCEYSPCPFASVGIIFASMGDIQTAAAYAKHSNLLMERVQSRTFKSHILFVSHCFSLHWTNPLANMLKPMLRSYEVGMQTGDTESAAWGIFHYMLIAFQACRPLESIASDGRVYSRQMDELEQQKQYTYICLTWQLCENLMGRANDPLILTGDAMNEEDYSNRGSAKHHHLLTTLHSYKVILYGFFGAYEECAELAFKYGDFSKEIPGSPVVSMCACMNGLSLCVMARRTKGNARRKYRRGANRFLSKVKSWIERGNPNLKHWESFLMAEFDVISSKKFSARSQYEAAIILASRGGFIQDAALFSERFGDFLVNEMDDTEEGVYRLEQAIRYYKEWGALGKVDQVETKYANLWKKPDEIVSRVMVPE